MTSIMVATPHTRPFDEQYVASLLYMQKPEMMFWSPLAGQAVDHARNILAGRFLKQPEEPEFLLFADSDATWHPEAVMRMASYNLPMVTGCIYRRGLPPNPTFGINAGVNEGGHHVYSFGWAIKQILEVAEKENLGLDAPNECILGQPGEYVKEIDGCGMHFCMVRRDVLVKLAEMLARPYVPFFQCTAGHAAGEDFDFCRKVQAAGFKIYADFGIHTGHVIGPGIEVGVRELLAFYKYNAEVAAKELWEV